MRAKIDWSTVELAGKRERVVERVSRTYPDRRGRSMLKRVLSGASMKARARGSALTHAQICALLEPGLDVLIYGIGLVAAVMLERSVDRAAYVIAKAALHLAETT